MESVSPAKGWHALSSHVAAKALFKSVVINMIAPAVIYSLAMPHFAAMSLAPLALSGTPPIVWLAHGIIKFRAIDFLGLFAAENVVVRMVALALQRLGVTETEQLAIALGQILPLQSAVQRCGVGGIEPDDIEIGQAEPTFGMGRIAPQYLAKIGHGAADLAQVGSCPGQ